MQMTFRWFGDGKDTVSLEQIRQIPGVVGVVPALHYLPCGEAWPLEDILKMKKEVADAGLTMECIESVNVHEDIKLGLPTRDKYIENYIISIRNLAKAGVKCICYNFMPVFDWTRTDLAMPLQDGSTCLCYFGEQIEGKTPEQMFKEIDDNSNGYAMPGWETERMPEIKELFEKYKGITAEDLWTNLQYFLEKIIPVCEECDVRMAIHPDDPPWDIFGLPRIIRDLDSLKRFLKLVDSPYNGLTFCTGSLGASAQNETGHLSADGSLDMVEIVKALQDVGFDGYIRPDHGRMIWGETARPGYGLYDRALGVAYINGVWEACAKMRNS